MLSREAAFLYNNVLLVGIAFSVMWGTLFPILSEAVRGTKITVGPPFFNAVNVRWPLLLALTASAAHRVASCVGVEPAPPIRRAGVRGRRRGCGVAGARMREWHALVAYTLAGFVRAHPAGVLQGSRRADAHARRESWWHCCGYRAQQRRYGGYIVHAGVVMLFCAFAGSVQA